MRFDWGAAGAERILPGAHVVVLVDALSFTTSVVMAAEHGVAIAPWGDPDDRDGATALARELGGIVAAPRGGPRPVWSPASADADASRSDVVVLASPNGGEIARALAHDPGLRGEGSHGPVVLAAALRNRAAVAERILALQEQRGERMIVAVVAAGERAGSARDLRPTVEDELVAGAVIDALVGLGIDHTSPEAAVACAAYEGLRQAAVHLISAAGSSVELRELGFGDDVRAATQRDVTRVVPELSDGVFRA